MRRGKDNFIECERSFILMILIWLGKQIYSFDNNTMKLCTGTGVVWCCMSTIDRLVLWALHVDDWSVGFMSVHEQSAQGIYATGSASATAGPSTPRESINTITLKAVVGWRWIEGLHSVACIHPVRWKALKLRLQSCCNCSTVNCIWDWNSQTEHSHLGVSDSRCTVPCTKVTW